MPAGSRRIKWPPEYVIDPDGDRLEVIDSDAGGAWLLLEGEVRVPASTVYDPETDWQYDDTPDES